MNKNKIVILALFAISSFSTIDINASNDYFDNYPKKSAILDALITPLEIAKIHSLGSKNEKFISNAAKLDQKKHIISVLLASAKAYTQFNLFNQVDLNSNTLNSKKEKGAFAGVRLANLIPHLAAYKFLKNDSKIKRNAKKIADYNKATNQNLFKKKLIQYSWLALNKIAPYAFFAWKKSIEQVRIDEEKSVYCLDFLKSISNLSEIARKHQRYKIEMECL